MNLPTSVRWFLVIVVGAFLIIVPFLIFGEWISDWISRLFLFDFPKPFLVLFVIAILTSDIVLPIPSSLTGLFAGALLGGFWGSITVWFGLMGGGCFGYFLGQSVDQFVNSRLFSEQELLNAKRLSSKYGGAGLVLTRAVPVFAELATLGAGLCRYSFSKFIVLLAMSNAGLAIVYSAIGQKASESKLFLLLSLGAIFLPFIAWCLWRGISLMLRRETL